MKPTTVAVVGLGLIGSSLARALVAAGHRVIGVDTPVVRRKALSLGFVSDVMTSAAVAAEVAEVVVLAAPPDRNLELLQALASTSALVTDVGSVKQPICRLASKLRLRFVGGHPMAGNTGSGLRASAADLFVDRPWILTPTRTTLPADVRRLRKLLAPTGARLATMTPAAHDRTVAFLSHVPQLVSWALLEAARGDAVTARHLALAGPGFVGMTRLASSPKPLWREIVGQNRDEVERAFNALARALQRLP